MENNQLVPIQVKDDSKEIICVQSKRKKSAVKGLIFLLFIAIIVVVAFNFSKIKGFFEKRFPSEAPIESDTNMESDSSTESTNVSPPQDIIPENCYEFIETTKYFDSLTNDTSFEIGSLECNIVSASEIYKKYGNDAPVALIIHSSALECYSNGKYYSQNDEFYSRDKNVAQIGDLICNELNSCGINSIHISNIFSNGSIFSSTKEYEKAIINALKKYPSIQYVLDISRGVQINDDLTMNKPTTIVNSTQMAQIKIVIGSDEANRFWENNLSLALKLATDNKDIIRDVTLSPFSLSQELSPTCMQIDVGDYSNTFEEASLVAIELARRLSSLIC